MKNITFKGTPGLLLENGSFKAVILPELGGKLASLYSKKHDFELIYQNQEVSYEKPDKYGNFGAYDVSGFDDCWPNIDAGKATYGYQTIDYPDHGDLWFRTFDYEYKEDQLRLLCISDLMPYKFEKTFEMTEEDLRVHYKITNTGDHPIVGFYTAHGLMNCEDDMVFIFPSDMDEILNVVRKGSKTLGDYESIHPYPVTKDLDGNDYRLDRTAGSNARKYEKFYGTKEVKEGRCGAYYPSINANFIMTFDPKKLPYIGLWLNECGGSGKHYNYAMEPTSGYYDSIAIAHRYGKYQTLNPKTSFEFTLALGFEDA